MGEQWSVKFSDAADESVRNTLRRLEEDELNAVTRDEAVAGAKEACAKYGVTAKITDEAEAHRVSVNDKGLVTSSV